MRQHRSIRVITAALAAATAGLVPALMTLPAAAADTVVASADSTNGSWAPFVQSGNPTLTVIDDGTGSNNVLNVAARAQDFEGISTAPPPASGQDVVWDLDFDAAGFTPWTQSGSATFDYVDDGNGGTALQLVRHASYDAIQSPAGVLEPGREYTFSFRAKAGADSTGLSDALRTLKLVSKGDSYATVTGTQVVITGDWQTVTGTYTIPADADPLTTQVYIGVGPYPEVSDAVTVIVDDLTVTTPAQGVNLTFDFEDGLQGWVARGDAAGDPSLEVTTAEAHGGAQAAVVTGRDNQGDGAGIDLTGTFVAGQTYDITAYVKMASGVAADDIWLSAKTTTGGTDSFGTVGTFAGVTANGWTRITASYTMPEAEAVMLYLETDYTTGSNGGFLIDDVAIATRVAVWDPTLTPMKDAIDVPLGVAIDSRETVGAPSELLLHHFDQVTPENHMKVEAWYDDAHSFQMNPEATRVMDFAVANDLRVYGHTLVWHSQTPDWFFQDAEGNFLTSADYETMKTRLHDHIVNVAEALSDAYGPFGSDTNPLVAFDVVNEVISDQATPDGLRTSHWYQIMGDDFISLAFQYADEAFNSTFAVADSVAARPITLMINDYNTEQDGKGARLHTLVKDLLDAGVPVDGVGHQMHVALSTAVGALEASLDRFGDLPVTQAVTELDVTVGTPVTTPSLIEQGYYFRDLFDVLRAHAEDLFSVTIWGLTDDRSWRSEQAPLVFDSALGAKQAYYGIADPAGLEPRIRTANAFQGSVAIDAEATSAPEWSQLPLHAVEDAATFQLRWMPDHLTAYVTVADTSVDATDAIAFAVRGATVTVHRDGTGDVPAVVQATPGGYTVVASIPLTPAATLGSSMDFDVEVTDGTTTTAGAAPTPTAR